MKWFWFYFSELFHNFKHLLIHSTLNEFYFYFNNRFIWMRLSWLSCFGGLHGCTLSSWTILRISWRFTNEDGGGDTFTSPSLSWATFFFCWSSLSLRFRNEDRGGDIFTSPILSWATLSVLLIIQMKRKKINASLMENREKPTYSWLRKWSYLHETNNFSPHL